MKKIFFVLISGLMAVGFLGCEKNEPETETVPTGTIIPVPTDVTVVGDSIVAPRMQRVAVHSSLTHAQPMTGLVLWPDQAADLDPAPVGPGRQDSALRSGSVGRKDRISLAGA